MGTVDQILLEGLRARARAGRVPIAYHPTHTTTRRAEFSLTRPEYPLVFRRACTIAVVQFSKIKSERSCQRKTVQPRSMNTVKL